MKARLYSSTLENEEMIPFIIFHSKLEFGLKHNQ